MKVYVDGVLQNLPVSEADDWMTTSSISVSDSTQVIGIECHDLHDQPGILASVSNGFLTDASWYCSPVFEAGWADPSFAANSGNWQVATTMGRNGDSLSPWNIEVSHIDADAEWIWTDRNKWPTDIDQTVYCRKVMIEPPSK